MTMGRSVRLDRRSVGRGERWWTSAAIEDGPSARSRRTTPTSSSGWSDPRPAVTYGVRSPASDAPLSADVGGGPAAVRSGTRAPMVDLPGVPALASRDALEDAERDSH